MGVRRMPHSPDHRVPSRLPRRGRLLLLLLLPLLLAADPRPLDPDFRPAAPADWLVVAGHESGYEWIRFSISDELAGDDYRDAAITLYRIVPRVKPEEAGEALVKLKAQEQKVAQPEKFDQTIEDVRWRGMAAAYQSGAGEARRELYLYTDSVDGALYLLWSRGPAAKWEGDEALRESVLRRVSLILMGKDVQEARGSGGT